MRKPSSTLLEAMDQMEQIPGIAGVWSEGRCCLCFGSLFFCTINSCPAPDGPRQNGQEEKNYV